ncbi:NRDE family protein [Sporosarcina sp. HYO08]|uniref:NRDE family protein n=1 Tax=Sporosarcina sp. HYO08 TaxID=1759557 RepID=UPI0007942FCC|nr:NRDE family protein [Sporosarcina sp. HYO08]KXH87065.1 hypothetical protein AU377_00345 [Sporosarcina sp. HYO08]
MCLITLHLKEHPIYKLIVAANRDEFYNRPTAPAHFWEDEPTILAGRDLLKGGTWLGVTKTGKFAALTNFRAPSEMMPKEKSRGEIVSNYLKNQIAPKDYLENIQKDQHLYPGFNILVGNPDDLYYYSNQLPTIEKVTPGTHALSNHLLNTPWPKALKSRSNLRNYVLANKSIDTDVLFDLLTDQEQAPDEQLPDTGIGLNHERLLSPLFIQMPEYGTRSSSVLLIDQNNTITFVERTYQNGAFANEKRFEFQA